MLLTFLGVIHKVTISPPLKPYWGWKKISPYVPLQTGMLLMKAVSWVHWNRKLLLCLQQQLESSGATPAPWSRPAHHHSCGRMMHTQTRSREAQSCSSSQLCVLTRGSFPEQPQVKSQPEADLCSSGSSSSRCCQGDSDNHNKPLQQNLPRLCLLEPSFLLIGFFPFSSWKGLPNSLASFVVLHTFE